MVPQPGWLYTVTCPSICLTAPYTVAKPSPVPWPVFFVVKGFGPIALFFRILFLEPVLRLFFGRAGQAQAMTLEEFRSLVDKLQKITGAAPASPLGQLSLFGEMKPAAAVEATPARTRSISMAPR